MTDREKAIVMAYTGACMLTGDKFQIFHKYVEEIMDRSIWTHEMAQLADEIKEKSKDDFMKLCADENLNEWIPASEKLPETDGVYIVTRRLFDNQIDTEPYYMVDACYFDGSNTWHNDNRINHSRHLLEDIIAWMPLPEPYKASPTGAESENKE